VVGTRECACICNPKKGKEKKLRHLKLFSFCMINSEGYILLYDWCLPWEIFYVPLAIFLFAESAPESFSFSLKHGGIKFK